MQGRARIATTLLQLLLVGAARGEISGCAVHSPTPNGYGQITCISCKPGAFRSIDGLACNPCTAGCTFCADSGICQTCIGGYYLTNGVCMSCGTGCNMCVGQDCTSCNEKYTLNATMHSCMKCDDTCRECDFTGGCTKCPDGHSRAQSGGRYVCVLIDGTSTGMVVFIVLACVVCVPLIICCVCFVFCCRDGGSSAGNIATSGIFSNNNPNPFFGMDVHNDAGYIANFYGGVNPKQPTSQPSQDASFEVVQQGPRNYDIPHSRPSPNLSQDTFPVPYFPPPSGFARRRVQQNASDHSNPLNAGANGRANERETRPRQGAAEARVNRNNKPDRPRNHPQDLKLDSFY